MKLYIAEQYNTLNQLDFMYYPDNTNKRYYYGPDRQRCKTALSRNDTLLYTRYYADNYEEVHEGNYVNRVLFNGK